MFPILNHTWNMQTLICGEFVNFEVAFQKINQAEINLKYSLGHRKECGDTKTSMHELRFG